MSVIFKSKVDTGVLVVSVGFFYTIPHGNTFSIKNYEVLCNLLGEQPLILLAELYRKKKEAKHGIQ